MKKIKINLNEQAKKKLLITGAIVIIVVIILCIALYIGNPGFRRFFDRHILRKEIVSNNVASIDISTLENPSIYAYSKYITILSKNKLTTYSSSGSKEYEHEISVSDAIYASNNRFLVVAQKNGQNLYVISEANLLWQTEIEGQIQKVNVNKNGYVSVIISGSTYKTIVATYSPSGKELFKTYLSSTIAIDSSISNDNKYLGIAEINTSGTLIQSNIKIVSVEKAQNDPTNSVIYIYNAEANKLITDIKYQNQNKLAVQYDDGVGVLYEENENQIISFKDGKITFASIELNNYSTYTVEKSAGLFNTKTQVILKNNITEKENIYTADGTVKDIKTHSGNIALNLGSQVDFINTNGWLIKKYVSEIEIKDIVIAESIAGIVYKDKVEIANI